MLFAGLLTIPMCTSKARPKTLDCPGGEEGSSLLLTPALPDTGAFCKNGADQPLARGLGETLPTPRRPRTVAIRAGRGSQATNDFCPRRLARREGEGDGKGPRGGYGLNFPASREEEPRVGEEEAEEKGVGAGQGPEPGRGGAGA